MRTHRDRLGRDTPAPHDRKALAMTSATTARVAGALTAALGAATVLDAARLTRVAAGGGGVPDPRIARVLGARQLVQGLTLALRPDPTLVRGAVAVDLLHAASMLPLGVTRFRRAALLSAATASTTALVAALAARQSSGQ